MLALLANISDDDGFNLEGGSLLYLLVVILVIVAIIYFVRRS